MKLILTLSIVLVLALIAGVVIAQFALYSNVHIVVTDPLAWVGQSDFDLHFWSGEQQNLTLTVRNNDTQDVNVQWTSEATSDKFGCYMPSYEAVIPAESDMSFQWLVWGNETCEGDLTLICYIVP